MLAAGQGKMGTQTWELWDEESKEPLLKKG